MLYSSSSLRCYFSRDRMTAQNVVDVLEEGHQIPYSYLRTKVGPSFPHLSLVFFSPENRSDLSQQRRRNTSPDMLKPVSSYGSMKNWVVVRLIRFWKRDLMPANFQNLLMGNWWSVCCIFSEFRFFPSPSLPYYLLHLIQKSRPPFSTPWFLSHKKSWIRSSCCSKLPLQSWEMVHTRWMSPSAHLPSLHLSLLSWRTRTYLKFLPVVLSDCVAEIFQCQDSRSPSSSKKRAWCHRSCFSIQDWWFDCTSGMILFPFSTITTFSLNC